MRALQLVIVAVTLVVASGIAAAYPQFELSRDKDCTGCHVTPAGGNLLNENGLAVADALSTYGTAPEFMYDKVPTPSWLLLGGDLRGAVGYLKTPEDTLAAFPMQAELYAHATFGNFAIHANFGPQTTIWSREHYVQWKPDADDTGGLFVRAGRFMPVFGLRLAEHPTYIRRYGGTQLWADTYGAAVEYLGDAVEAHVTGFIEDPISDPVEHVDGAAALVEYRLSDHVSVGAEGMIELGADDRKYRGGLIGKLYLEPQDLLIQAELQYVLQVIEPAGVPKQIVGYVMASRMVHDAVLLDVAIGHFDSNIAVARLDRDCVDLNLHWFVTSHFELVLNSRYELIGWGKGGDPGAYAILQGHYRL